MEEWKDRWRAAQAGNLSAPCPVKDSTSVDTLWWRETPKRSIPAAHGTTTTVLRPGFYSETTADITTFTGNIERDIPRMQESLPKNHGMLVVIKGPAAGRCLGVSSDRVTIGRDPGNDIVLDDPTVSRRHAVIHRHGTRFTIRDVGSQNGTYLRQVKLDAESRLPANARLQMGAFRMLFIRGSRKAI